jgi:hypothetical protein
MILLEAPLGINASWVKKKNEKKRQEEKARDQPLLPRNFGKLRRRLTVAKTIKSGQLTPHTPSLVA